MSPYRSLRGNTTCRRSPASTGSSSVCSSKQAHDTIARRRPLDDSLGAYLDTALQRVRNTLRYDRKMEPFEAVRLSIRRTHDPTTLEDEVEHDVRRARQSEAPSGVQQAGREWLHAHEDVS